MFMGRSMHCGRALDDEPSLVTARYGHTVTLLPNGKLLAVGGYSTNFSYLASAELSTTRPTARASQQAR